VVAAAAAAAAAGEKDACGTARWKKVKGERLLHLQQKCFLTFVCLTQKSRVNSLSFLID